MKRNGASFSLGMMIGFLTMALVPALVSIWPEQIDVDFTAGIASRLGVAQRHQAFMENAGQIANEDVRYYASFDDMSMGFGESEIMLNFKRHPIPSPLDSPTMERPTEHATSSIAGVLIHLKFVGANGVLPKGLGEQPYRSNFLLGNNPSKWRESVLAYREIVYTNIYDGINLIYHATGNGLKYEFLVNQSAEPSQIVFMFEGVDEIKQDTAGNLVIHTPIGDIVDIAPTASQGENPIRCEFVILSTLSAGLDCDRRYSNGLTVIDPLIYATYLGGAPGDFGPMQGRAIKVDSSGDAYVAGLTESVVFPTIPGAYDTSFNGDGDVFVAKLDAAGNALLYSTYLGGAGFDLVWSISVDSLGNTYIAGETNSTDFPVTSGVFDTSYNGGIGDAFVTKLNSNGSGLVYSTYLGGLSKDDADSIAIDSSGYAYVAGATMSADFPVTLGALNTSYIPADPEQAFVAKFDSKGTTLAYSTYLGGSAGMEWAKSIAIDSSGNAYVTGATSSTDFPITLGAYQASFGGIEDAFVTKLNPAGNSSMYSTYLGGGGPDIGLSIALNPSDEAYVSGRTESSNIPTTVGAFDTSYNGMRDVFITQLDRTGGAAVYSTYLGGSADDYGYSINLDSSGGAYVSGRTQSGDFPVTPAAFDTSFNGGGNDAFLSRLDPSGRRLLHSTFIGGGGYDYALSGTLDLPSYVYMTGGTSSPDFPTTSGALDSSYNGGSENAFVVKLYPAAPDLTIESSDIILLPPGPVSPDTLVVINVTIHNIGGTNVSSVVARVYDGPPSSSIQIGADQNVPFIQANGGTSNFSIDWSTSQAGVHEICAFADPDDMIAEEDETNNIACGSIEVLFAPQLTPGHRLISFPFSVPDDSVESVLSSIAGCYDYVRWYDALDLSDQWKSYMPGRSYNDLTKLDNTMGFWINVTAMCTFTPAGTRPMSTSINLRQGWNMIGFPSFNTTYTVGDLKAAIALAGIIVEAFDANAAPYYLQRVSDSYVMKAGEGYWLYVPSDAIWMVND